MTRIWAERGSRPRAPRDQRYDWAYLFGAVCPARDAGAALVLPVADGETMNLHLAEISRNVTPGSHAVVLLDGAGWHQTGGKLKVPDNTQADAQQWGAAAPGSSTVVIPPRAEASADPRRAVPRDTARPQVAAEPILTEGHIARLRAILRLTPVQQPHWLPVEVALSDLARHQARGATAAATTMHLRRIKAIAMPLIMTLDDNQKREAIAFGRMMGFQQLRRCVLTSRRAAEKDRAEIALGP